MAKFEFDGEKYQKASKHQKEWGRKLIDEININEDDIVLDLGCGDGLLTKIIKDIAINGYVLGIDASEGMILKAKEYQTHNLEFKKLNINDIEFKETFTIIVSNATLHWLKDHKKLLENCYKSLKKDGIFRFNFAGEGNCSHLIKVILSIIKEDKYQNYFNNFEWPWYMPGKNEYEKIIDTVGKYSEYKIWEENADRYFNDENEMIKWIDQPSLVPFLKNIENDEIKNIFRNEVVDKMVKLTKKNDGRCFETFRRINIYAKK